MIKLITLVAFQQDIEVDGYLIPKGSMIMPLMWRIHRDARYWQDPLKFMPKRFLNSEGQVKKVAAFMPFQTGATDEHFYFTHFNIFLHFYFYFQLLVIFVFYSIVWCIFDVGTEYLYICLYSFISITQE